MRYWILLMLMTLYGCDRCDKVDCFPCPAQAELLIEFETTPNGYLLSELDSTLIIKYDRNNGFKATDTTYVLLKDLAHVSVHSIRLENPSLTLNQSQYDYMVVHKQGKFSKMVKEIAFRNFPSDGKGCCNCSYFTVEGFRLNDTFTMGNIVTIRK